MSSGDDAEIGQKRKAQDDGKRTTRAKSRRVIEDSDEGENEAMLLDEQPNAADNVKNRLLGRLKKAEQNAEDRNKPKTIQKKEQKAESSISKKSVGIPRKATDTSKAESDALLSEIKVPPSAPIHKPTPRSPMRNPNAGQPKPRGDGGKRENYSPVPNSRGMTRTPPPPSLPEPNMARGTAPPSKKSTGDLQSRSGSHCPSCVPRWPRWRIILFGWTK